MCQLFCLGTFLRDEKELLSTFLTSKSYGLTDERQLEQFATRANLRFTPLVAMGFV